jgi:hypothetical protein
MDKVIGACVLLNYLLIVAFVFKGPSVSFTDFRLYASMFAGISVFSGIGLQILSEKYRLVRFILPTLVALMFFFDLAWIVVRFWMKAFLNI